MSEDDPVARNRAQHPRRTPDRTPVGWQTTLRWMRVTAAAVAVSTAVLVAVLVLAG